MNSDKRLAYLATATHFNVYNSVFSTLLSTKIYTHSHFSCGFEKYVKSCHDNKPIHTHSIFDVGGGKKEIRNQQVEI